MSEVGRPLAVGGRARRLREGARRGPIARAGRATGAAVWGVAGTASSHPPGAQIAFFECDAAVPDAVAARSFQYARQRRRASSCVARRGAKSRAAIFDVDLGGHLGFGARVPRAYAAADARARRHKRGQRAAHSLLAGRLAEGSIAE